MDELVRNPLLILNSGLIVALLAAVARWVSRVTIEIEGLKKDLEAIEDKDLKEIRRRLEGLELRAFALGTMHGRRDRDRDHE